MTLTDPNNISIIDAFNAFKALEDRVAEIERQLRALERRADQDDAIRDKLREMAAPSECGIPGTNVSVSILGDQRVGVSIPVAK